MLTIYLTHPQHLITLPQIDLFAKLQECVKQVRGKSHKCCKSCTFIGNAQLCRLSTYLLVLCIRTHTLRPSRFSVCNSDKLGIGLGTRLFNHAVFFFYVLYHINLYPILTMCIVVIRELRAGISIKHTCNS